MSKQRCDTPDMEISQRVTVFDPFPVRDSTQLRSSSVKVINNFEGMALREDLLRGIYAYGFERPSAIQQRAIKPIVEGRDVISQSQSGTGKTAVFCIAMLQVLDSATNETQMLTLSHWNT